MRGQSSNVNIENSQQERATNNRDAPSANSYTSEESEESLPDSLGLF
jgi:hypothetical protein